MAALWDPLPNRLWLWGKHTMTAHQTWLRIDRHVAPSPFRQSPSFLKRLTNLIKGRSRRLYWHETYQGRVMYKTWILLRLCSRAYSWIYSGLCCVSCYLYCKYSGMCDAAWNSLSDTRAAWRVGVLGENDGGVLFYYQWEYYDSVQTDFLHTSVWNPRATLPPLLHSSEILI